MSSFWFVIANMISQHMIVHLNGLGLIRKPIYRNWFLYQVQVKHKGRRKKCRKYARYRGGDYNVSIFYWDIILHLYDIIIHH